MGKMKDLYTAGVTDVHSYLLGKDDSHEIAIRAISAEIHEMLKKPVLVDREFIDGLERAIDIIKAAHK